MTDPIYVAGNKSILKLETVSGTFTAIAGINSITAPNQTVAEVPTTNLDSSQGSYRPSSIVENDAVTFEILFNPADATHVILHGLIAAPAIKNWKLVLNNTAATTFSFAGFLTSFQLSGFTNDENILASITVKISGAVVKSETP